MKKVHVKYKFKIIRKSKERTEALCREHVQIWYVSI